MQWMDEFVNVEFAGLTLGTFAVVWTVRRISQRYRSKAITALKRFFWKTAPAWPIILATSGALWLPGLLADDSTGLKVLKGLVAGLLAPWGRKFINRLVKEKLGDLAPDIAPAPAAAPSEGPPEGSGRV